MVFGVFRLFEVLWRLFLGCFSFNSQCLSGDVVLVSYLISLKSREKLHLSSILSRLGSLGTFNSVVFLPVGFSGGFFNYQVLVFYEGVIDQDFLLNSFYGIFFDQGFVSVAKVDGLSSSILKGQTLRGFCTNYEFLGDSALLNTLLGR